MEIKIIVYKKSRKFILYKISQLIDFDFDKKFKKSYVLISSFFTRSLLVDTWIALALLILPSLISNLSAWASFILLLSTISLLAFTLANIPVYFI